jgi:hypothetical protein
MTRSAALAGDPTGFEVAGDRQFHGVAAPGRGQGGFFGENEQALAWEVTGSQEGRLFQVRLNGRGQGELVQGGEVLQSADERGAGGQRDFQATAGGAGKSATVRLATLRTKVPPCSSQIMGAGALSSSLSMGSAKLA